MREKFRHFFIHFLVILLAVPAVITSQLWLTKPVRAKAYSAVPVINEIMWSGSRWVDQYHVTQNDSSDVWIELYNPTDYEMVMGGDWSLVVGSKSFPLNASSSIPARGYYLITEHQPGSSSILDASLNSSPQVKIQKEDSLDTYLNSTCQSVKLTDSTYIFDHVDCASGNWAAGDPSNYRSMERDYHSDFLNKRPLTDQWHSSIGFVNLVDSAKGLDNATPGFVNDNTLPTAGTVNDGIGSDIAFQVSQAEVSGNWSGFSDLESGIDHYQVYCSTTVGDQTKLCPGEAKVIDNVPASMLVESISNLNLTLGQTYYFNVVAVNGVDLATTSGSNGVTINQTPPNSPTLKVKDTPSDNGGSITAEWTDAEVHYPVTYTLEYWEKSDPSKKSELDNISGLTTATTGLKDIPTVYQFQVFATDSNGLEGPLSNIAETSAVDNSVPILDSSKVVVHQNAPGTEDTIEGVAGATDKPSNVYVLSDPNDPNSSIGSGSIKSHPDGSFPAIGIGDNQYPTVWIQLVNPEDSSLKSQPQSFANDIVAPNAPTLTKVEAKCTADPCRVNLSWQDNGPDTVRYQVGYTTGGVEKRSLDLNVPNLAIDLPANLTYTFKVYAFDAAGNESPASNGTDLRLTLGVDTISEFIGGVFVTTTSAISGAKEVVQAPATSSENATLLPQAQAAEPAVTNGPTETPSPTETAAASTSSDWVRIFVVVVILLIIAGSFYALSRSISEDPENGSPTEVEDSKTKDGSSPKDRRPNNRSSRRRRR